jgi:hypothetical protein
VLEYKLTAKPLLKNTPQENEIVLQLALPYLLTYTLLCQANSTKSLKFHTRCPGFFSCPRAVFCSHLRYGLSIQRRQPPDSPPEMLSGASKTLASPLAIQQTASRFASQSICADRRQSPTVARPHVEPVGRICTPFDSDPSVNQVKTSGARRHFCLRTPSRVGELTLSGVLSTAASARQ